jgi:DNA-binding SARP family transcriptional activator
MVAVDKILEAFWPNTGLDKARHNLSQQLSSLRRFLGAPNALQWFGDSYRLFAEGEGTLDVAEFEAHYTKGLNQLKRAQSEEAEASLLQAESLYRGDFLEEDSYEDWIEERRRKLREAFEHLNESLGDLYLHRGCHEQALSRYRRLLHQEEPQERLFHKAFQCYEALGDRQGARRDYEILRGRLKEGAGVEPQESTRALLQSLFLQN